VTRDALNAAIKICGPGVPFKRIGATIHDIADKQKLGVIRE
jgi:methionyl aminopeptidase